MCRKRIDVDVSIFVIDQMWIASILNETTKGIKQRDEDRLLL
jgi:hypothetical protein